ncbi:unnamed protein product [Urochloa humidicola]
MDARWGALLALLLVAGAGGARAAGAKGASWVGGLSRASFPKGFVFGTATSAYQVEGAASTNGRDPPSGTHSRTSQEKSREIKMEMSQWINTIATRKILIS